MKSVGLGEHALKYAFSGEVHADHFVALWPTPDQQPPLDPQLVEPEPVHVPLRRAPPHRKKGAADREPERDLLTRVNKRCSQDRSKKP